MFKYYIYVCFNTCLLFRSLPPSWGRSRDNHLQRRFFRIVAAPRHTGTYVPIFYTYIGVVRSVTATRALADYALRQWYGRKRADVQERRRRQQCSARNPPRSNASSGRSTTTLYRGFLRKTYKNILMIILRKALTIKTVRQIKNLYFTTKLVISLPSRSDYSS